MKQFEASLVISVLCDLATSQTSRSEYKLQHYGDRAPEHYSDERHTHFVDYLPSYEHLYRHYHDADSRRGNADNSDVQWQMIDLPQDGFEESWDDFSESHHQVSPTDAQPRQPVHHHEQHYERSWVRSDYGHQMPVIEPRQHVEADAHPEPGSDVLVAHKPDVSEHSAPQLSHEHYIEIDTPHTVAPSI